MIDYSMANAPLQKELSAGLVRNPMQKAPAKVRFEKGKKYAALSSFLESVTEEVGYTAAFLSSPMASAITGAVVYVDNSLNAMGVGVDSPIFPRKAAGVRIAGQGAPIEAAPAKKGCEREVSEAANGVLDELKSERIIRLSWALVHSKQPEDMQHGIAMLEDPCQKLNNSSLAASLANSGSPLQKREKLYLLAVGYYRSGEYRRSRQLAEQCLEIAPDWMQALTLKKTLNDQITKDGLIGIGITATVVGLVAGGIAASLG
ncbi:unnamed protein product [Camellia sinensis]